jgi:hypothetical protein
MIPVFNISPEFREQLENVVDPRGYEHAHKIAGRRFRALGH